jgi:hypothetical protein
MSKPYQSETYDEEGDTKEYINLSGEGVQNSLFVLYNDVTTFTLGTDAYDNNNYVGAYKFTDVIKTSSMNYSNGIITINKSGNFRLTFKGITFLFSSRATLFNIKKNGISIAETAIQPSRQYLADGSQQVDSVMFLSPIFRVNNGDNVRIDVSMDYYCVNMVILNVFLQEI